MLLSHLKQCGIVAMSLSKAPGISSNGHSDVILPMQDPYMDQIVNGTKNYEFRKYLLKSSVKRIWFYRTAPHSEITHVCETRPAKTRNPNDTPLDEDGLGNTEFNTHAKDWEGYDFAYKIDSVYELREPITLKELKEKHGFKSAPRGRVYLPLSISNSVDWKEQKIILQRTIEP
ncbi:PUA-like domain-containing protein [Aspergillus heterothallicus]